ncbi:hypothetical protein YC2023_025629 [Brassica napus]
MGLESEWLAFYSSCAISLGLDCEPDPKLKLSCRQRSPFLQNNYRDSSFKQLFFVYTVPLLHAEIHMLGFGTLILSGTSQSVAIPEVKIVKSKVRSNG